MNSLVLRQKRHMALPAAILLALVIAFSGAMPAWSATPPTPVSAFNAPLCPGSTMSDPTSPSSGPNDSGPAEVSDLTSVFGQRLTDYNAGKVVALYDTFGDNSVNGYPAVCGTRYVEGEGAVSEWMFCTDIFSHVCSGTDAQGNLLNYDGDPIPGIEQVQSNPKLTADKEKVISWLIQKGHDYVGNGYYSWSGVSQGRSDGTTEERLALQTLIWCVSDPVAIPASKASEQERHQTCEDSLDQTEQDRILAMIPDVPAVTLDLADSTQELNVGETAQFKLATNLYEQPITVTTTGAAGSLQLSSTNASFDQATGELTVFGSDPTVTTEVEFEFTSSAEGTVEISVDAEPASTLHINWNQSPGISADSDPCQVFATFSESDQVRVRDSAQAKFAAEPSTNEPTTSEPATTEPATEPGTTDSTTTEPGTTDSTTTEPATTEPATEPGTTDSTTTEPATTETTGSSASGLANTGIDLHSYVILGVVLVVAGLGFMTRKASRTRN